MPNGRILNMQVRLDKEKLERLIEQSPQKAGQALRSGALDGERWVKQLVSSHSSPSAPGSPPATVTGKLMGAINAKKIREFMWSINTGDTEYAVYLEYGTHNKDGSIRMEHRPFMNPLSVWLEGEMSRFFDRYLED